MTARSGCPLAFGEGRCHRSGAGDATMEPAEPVPVARCAAQAAGVKAAA
ncbi:hypothetical protein BLA23254_02876 [Burkholderia lata]|uniref:Uncharacterized protein n=1 Tax=Burkholderia lata (strain ATCC 17760 / DSM 23089 / LMG 22485 / NCIMB 9086 / R18194 / 383) TaxID=482957 RepID=A0A6P2L5Q7_BURL3|nr:hypothetical protein [Burkholderia lata]VWB62114.1 hypothetical protein BLA23254_02876 [Burkholderia lata]